jgi:hypothetical protein
VPWTKPDDYQFDPSNPKQGLGGIRPFVFLAVFFDSHVERIDDDTPPEVVGAMMTRGGREQLNR